MQTQPRSGVQQNLVLPQLKHLSGLGSPSIGIILGVEYDTWVDLWANLKPPMSIFCPESVFENGSMMTALV